MTLFDKQIHKDQFKLRLLLTDGCNKDCPFCLNDFQKKPRGSFRFLDSDTALTAISAYRKLGGGFARQVYFSGGEPTLHRGFADMAAEAQRLGCSVVVNTNGAFPDAIETELSPVPEMHFGVYAIDPVLADRIKRLNGTVQCVYSTRYPYVDRDFIEFYVAKGLPVKVYGDFFEEDHGAYERFAEQARSWFPAAKLSFRFTGVQENRGPGCAGCKLRCCTLKAAHVFPDGGVSHCQQGVGEVYYPGSDLSAWVDALKEIERCHRV